MELLNSEERAFVDRYLRLDKSGAGWAPVGIVVGILLCLAAIVLLVILNQDAGPSLFLGLFIAGLVIVKISLDERRARRIAAILRKYEQALGKGERSPQDADEG